MKPVRTTGVETLPGVRSGDRLGAAIDLDAQLSELIETVWACERQWTLDDRIDAVIKYGRQ